MYSKPVHLGDDRKGEEGKQKKVGRKGKKKKEKRKKKHGCKGRALVEDSTSDVHAATRFVICEDPSSVPAHGRHALLPFLYLHFLFRQGSLA